MSLPVPVGERHHEVERAQGKDEVEVAPVGGVLVVVAVSTAAAT